MVLSDENQSHMTTIQDDKAEMTALFLQFGSLSPKGQCYAKLLKIISCPSQWSVWSFSHSVCIELLWMLHFSWTFSHSPITSFTCMPLEGNGVMSRSIK